ncbi:uncharacterized protein LOC122064291 [Macadamia integrifolia]|uniref:uncharacterized protein LOC122064291 n=1 Tax=Macadamia integrifolia TaxID=60698 RepID=UPI001C4F1CC4|nr:uncharacterized protein LOC122064291 [Macadamia integrifolia]
MPIFHFDPNFFSKRPQITLKQKFYGQSFKALNTVNSREFQECFNHLDGKFDQFCDEWGKVCKDHVFDRPWKHVLRETGENESDTSQLYKDAVASVETQARAVYVEEDLMNCSQDEFLQLMMEQGCFILQVALCSLGGPKPLGYPPDDPLFGEKRWNYKLIRFLVNRYLFCIKNQIPLVVLEVLMKQSFFQNVLKLGKWKRPNDLAGMVLYDFLVEPMLDGYFQSRRHPAITLLHALWLKVTGSDSHGTNHIKEDVGHLYTNLSTVNSAKELQAAGITFKNYEGFDMRGIKFKKRMLDAHLYLPYINMEPHNIALFEGLIHFERDANLNINQREVSAYITFMSELIRSRDDVRVLVTGGILDSDLEYEQQLPNTLSKLVSQFDRLMVGNIRNFASIRGEIRRYVRPSMRTKIMNLVVIGLVLTLVQTIYTVLSYHHPHH